MSKIRVLKLISGEEICGTVLNDDITDEVVIENTIAIVNMQDPQTGQPMPTIWPWGNAGMDPKTFSRDHVLYITDPKPSLLSEYQKTFGKIVTQPKGILLND